MFWASALAATYDCVKLLEPVQPVSQHRAVCQREKNFFLRIFFGNNKFFGICGMWPHYVIGKSDDMSVFMCKSPEKYWIRILVQNQNFHLLHLCMEISNDEMEMLLNPSVNSSERHTHAEGYKYSSSLFKTINDTNCYKSQEFQMVGNLRVRHCKVYSKHGNYLFSEIEVYFKYVECDKTTKSMKTDVKRVSRHFIECMEIQSTNAIENIINLYVPSFIS